MSAARSDGKNPMPTTGVMVESETVSSPAGDMQARGHDQPCQVETVRDARILQSRVPTLCVEQQVYPSVHYTVGLMTRRAPLG